MRRFEGIQAWQRARDLAREIYKAGAEGPLARDIGLRDQIRRTAVSSLSNVAEGFARKSEKEFARFLDMARGSAIDVHYMDGHDFERLNRLADEAACLIGA
jgi:four helix bundle protein